MARLYRMGGDEFLLLMAPAEMNGRHEPLEAFHVRCTQSAVTLSGGINLYVRAAFGVCQREAGRPLDLCLARTDQQMYAAKRQQKKRCTDTP